MDLIQYDTSFFSRVSLYRRILFEYIQKLEYIMRINTRIDLTKFELWIV